MKMKILPLLPPLNCRLTVLYKYIWTWAVRGTLSWSWGWWWPRQQTLRIRTTKLKASSMMNGWAHEELLWLCLLPNSSNILLLMISLQRSSTVKLLTCGQVTLGPGDSGDYNTTPAAPARREETWRRLEEWRQGGGQPSWSSPARTIITSVVGLKYHTSM